MQIALTKKLAKAMEVKPAIANEAANPLYSWTANWTNTFENRKEDMLVMMNNATRFAVAIYGIKGNQFKNIGAKMKRAISNTLIALNVNPEVVDEYLSRMGEIEFVTNDDRKLTAQLNRCGLEAAIIIGRILNESETKIKYEDTLGRIVSEGLVNYGKSHEDSFIPSQKMLEMLSELTGKPAYRYPAFELLITLDLDIYKAVRRVIVPANLSFSSMHKIIQNLYDWKDYHLYDFTVFKSAAMFKKNRHKPLARLVPSEETLEYDESAIVMTGHNLSEYMPENKFLIYTYDMGDNWEHEIELVREIPEHHELSPFLLEASGQSPPEDVGGVGGYIDFREIMLDPKHPEYEQMKEWAGYWRPELEEYEARPRKIYY